MVTNQGDLFRERAIEILSEEASKKEDGENRPFFLYLSLPHVHWPVLADLNYTDLYPRVDDGRNRRKYLGMVSHMDSVVGSVVGALRDNGQYGNTVIAASSDNGGYATM